MDLLSEQAFIVKVYEPGGLFIWTAVLYYLEWKVTLCRFTVWPKKYEIIIIMMILVVMMMMMMSWLLMMWSFPKVSIVYGKRRIGFFMKYN